MKSTKVRIIPCMVIGVFILAIFIAGCAPQTRYRLEPGDSASVDHQLLQQNWSDYFIHYNTRIVVFDPITDTHTIQVGDRWILIEDSEELAAIFTRLGLMPRKGLADIYQIVDSQGIVYGYLIYASSDLVSFKKIDDTTVRLYYQAKRQPDAP